MEPLWDARLGSGADNRVWNATFTPDGSIAFVTRQEAQTALFDYIETFYNRERLHSTLGYRSPDEYERDHKGGGDYASRTDEMIFIEEQARAA